MLRKTIPVTGDVIRQTVCSSWEPFHSAKRNKFDLTSTSYRSRICVLLHSSLLDRPQSKIAQGCIGVDLRTGLSVAAMMTGTSL